MNWPSCLIYLVVCMLQAQFVSSASPHIVFIMVDDLGWNDVGYHGSEIQTPNLDALAASGVKLENYYTAPICGPTRTQFLSGRYGINLGLQSRNLEACIPTGLPTEFETIADKLKERDYSTHLIGKWHAGFHTEAYLPNNRGFDTFRGFLNGHGDHYEHTRKYNGEGYLDYRDNFDVYNSSWGDYSTTIFTQRAKEIIETYGERTKPMFLFLSHQAPHNPLDVPEKYIEQYKHITVSARRKYAGMVSAIDEGVGELVDTLKSKGIFDNTVIIFTTDNGGGSKSGGSNYPLRGQKGQLYEGGMRAVGFVSGPLISQSQKGKEVTDLIHITDWMPTLLSLAGSQERLDIDGINQWETIRRGQPSKRTEILHNINPDTKGRRRANMRAGFDISQTAAIRVGDWKLITGSSNPAVAFPNPATNVKEWWRVVQHPSSARVRRGRRPATGFENSRLQLYNIAADPSENRNLAHTRPRQVDDMLRRLAQHSETMRPPIKRSVTDKCDPTRHGGVWAPYLTEEEDRSGNITQSGRRGNRRQNSRRGRGGRRESGRRGDSRRGQRRPLGDRSDAITRSLDQREFDRGFDQRFGRGFGRGFDRQFEGGFRRQGMRGRRFGRFRRDTSSPADDIKDVLKGFRSQENEMTVLKSMEDYSERIQDLHHPSGIEQLPRPVIAVQIGTSIPTPVVGAARRKQHRPPLIIYLSKPFQAIRGIGGRNNWRLNY